MAEEEQSKETILSTIKEGLADVYDESFDTDLLFSINGYLANLNQIGVGKQVNVFLKKDTTWDDFFGDSTGNRGTAMQYVYQKTKLDFDPPSYASSVTTLQKSTDEAYWRAQREFDNGL